MATTPIVGRAVDTILDRSIVLGYGSAGLAVRRLLPGWPAEPPRMDGRSVLVTGAASGLGLATAVGFAQLGAAVHVLGRSDRRAADAADAVRTAVPGAVVTPQACDISDLHALVEFARAFARREARLDVLVNNAGVMPEERSRSAQGHELMFATHVLAPFALTLSLAELLGRHPPGRVINISSGGMYSQRIPSGDLESDDADYSPAKLYARTKREEVVITELLAEHLRGEGVIVHAMHPGWADTTGVQTSLPLFLTITRPIIRSSAQGADTIVWMGAADEPLRSTGRFWHDRRQRPTHYLVGAGKDDPADRERLWDHCQEALRAA